MNLVSVPPGVAHLVLPLDVGVAASLESAASRAAQRWQTANCGASITHRVCAHILQKVRPEHASLGEKSTMNCALPYAWCSIEMCGVIFCVNVRQSKVSKTKVIAAKYFCIKNKLHLLAGRRVRFFLLLC